MRNEITNWAGQQESIFSFFVTAEGHLVVRARAGTGKTTTIVEAVKRWIAANPGKRAVVCAFNKRIAEELIKKFGLLFDIKIDATDSRYAAQALERAVAAYGVEVKTLHAIGYACCRRFKDRLKVEFTTTRADKLAFAVCGSKAPDAVVHLVARLHTKGREIAPHAAKLGDLTTIALAHECEPDEIYEASGYGLEYVEAKALEAMELAANISSGDTIDGSDMIFLPIRNGWISKQADLVVVDEAQDMTTAQLEIAQGILNANGRMAIVGDDMQAIYGFRGADSGSLDRLKAELNAAELGLTTTYRCGKAIVDLARRWVDDFEAGPDNSEGRVSELTMNRLTASAGPGDFILSRTNAPLVSTAMSLLRAGKRTRVAGRDIGKGLIGILMKLKARTVPELITRIEGWRDREVLRQNAKLKVTSNGRSEAIKAKIDAITDQADMLCNLADGARNVAEIMERADALFADDGLGSAGVITCSSVHRAKGLEADRVFVLRNTLRDTTQEEKNICYVAITRAKAELVWVYSEEETKRMDLFDEPAPEDQLPEWLEVPQARFLSWPPGQQFAYCAARDEASALEATTVEEFDWYRARASRYREMMNK